MLIWANYWGSSLFYVKETERRCYLFLQFKWFLQNWPWNYSFLFGRRTDNGSSFCDKMDIRKKLPKFNWKIIDEMTKFLLNFLLYECKKILIITLIFKILKYLNNSFLKFLSKLNFLFLFRNIIIIFRDDGNEFILFLVLLIILRVTVKMLKLFNTLLDIKCIVFYYLV